MFKILALGVFLSFSLTINANTESNQAIELEYKSYEEALLTLKNNKNSIIESDDGWILGRIWDKKTNTGTVWVFSSESSDIHPSVGVIELFIKNGKLSSKLKILCKAKANDCEAFTLQMFHIKDKALKNIRLKKEKGLLK